MSKTYIDEEIPVEFCDEGPWRSYHLHAEGRTFYDLGNDAWIVEVDQDGGELRHYPLHEAETEELFLAAWQIILREGKKIEEKARESEKSTNN